MLLYDSTNIISIHFFIMHLESHRTLPSPSTHASCTNAFLNTAGIAKLFLAVSIHLDCIRTNTITVNTEVRRVRMRPNIQNAIGHFQSWKANKVTLTHTKHGSARL